MNETNGKMTAGQKAMLAADAVLRHELGVADAARLYNSSATSVNYAMKIKQKSIDVASEVRRGKITITRGLERVGYRPVAYKVGGNVTVGDQWDRALAPALSYARHWAGREYDKLNPREAGRRLKVLRELRELLGTIEGELAERSQTARLKVGR